MKATVGPQRAVELLRVEHNAVREIIDELSEEEMTRPDTIRYGMYADQRLSFKDLLAHLICYEALALAAMAAWQRGERHQAIDVMRSPARSHSLHYSGIADRSEHSLAQVLDEWERCHAGLEDAIAALDEDQWRSPAPWPEGEPLDLGGMVEEIIVTPPRPFYRHLPVHVPDSAEYIRSLR